MPTQFIVGADTHRKDAVRLVIGLQGQPQLLQVIAALQAPSRLAGALHGRQEQRYENADNCNHDQ